MFCLQLCVAISSGNLGIASSLLAAGATLSSDVLAAAAAFAKKYQQSHHDPHGWTVSSLLFAFGKDDFQLGIPSRHRTHGYWFPKAIPTSRSIHVKTISTSRYHTAIVTSAGEVWVWGIGSQGQLGLGLTRTTSVSPVQLDALKQKRCTSVSVSNTHTLVVTTSGVVYAWGA